LNQIPDTDLDKLSSLKAFSWLSVSDMRLLAGALEPTNFKRREVILREDFASEAHILLKGIASISCQNAHRERVTVALIAPGPIPELPSLPMSRFDFRCEAYSNCRVGTLNLKGFEGITSNGPRIGIQEVP
jgi:hypothetical protein